MLLVAELQEPEHVCPPQQTHYSAVLHHRHLVQRVFDHELQRSGQVGLNRDRLEGHRGHDAARRCRGPQLLRDPLGVGDGDDALQPARLCHEQRPLAPPDVVEHELVDGHARLGHRRAWLHHPRHTDSAQILGERLLLRVDSAALFKNQPMNAVHNPPNTSPLKSREAPQKMSTNPKPCPT
jgi:hypothetical protein